MADPILKPPSTSPDHKKEDKFRKPYSKPQLTNLGDLRTLTLGASQGNSIDTDLLLQWV